jgi:hypothetical protein
MSDHDHLDVLDPFEGPEEYPARPSVTALFRRLRIKWMPRTIRIHEADLDAVLRYPLGATWRRYQGRAWCPMCSSLSPHTLLAEMRRSEYWDREQAASEFRSLVERNEMSSTSENWHKVLCPPKGTGYGQYNFNPMLGRFDVFTFYSGTERFGFNIMHLYDLSTPDRSLAIGHMNRLAPGVHWQMDAEGVLGCSHTSLVAYANSGDDSDDDTDPDDQG